jgi:hypothetical protein
MNPRTPVETPAMMPGRNGGALRRGGINPKHNGGRPPDEFAAKMRGLATYAEKAGLIERVLKDIHHPFWLGALKYVTDRGYGKAKESVDMKAKVTVRVIRVPRGPLRGAGDDG